MNEWVEIIKNLGLPTALCIYLLWERQKSLNMISQTMVKLVEKMEILISKHE